MSSPTPRQASLLRYIAGYLEAKGYAPSVSDMCGGLSWGRADVHRRLCALEERGWIRRLHHRARAIELLYPVSIPRDPDGQPLYAVQFG